MDFEIIATDDFLKSVKRIYKKQKSLLNDLESLEQLLSKNPTFGTSLGNNLFKIRLAISSSGMVISVLQVIWIFG